MVGKPAILLLAQPEGIAGPHPFGGKGHDEQDRQERAQQGWGGDPSRGKAQDGQDKQAGRRQEAHHAHGGNSLQRSGRRCVHFLFPKRQQG
ncbi:hypothetical protein GCM10022280_02220 [Sphingomonas swuensis]|uniref:Uncharacterized protein n=1 Tax=Sphingomonas swuensis TaxID=977800 RepID=A0ABP7SAE4_9SPHN